MSVIQCLCSGELHTLGTEKCQRELVPNDQLIPELCTASLGLCRTGDPEVTQRLYFKHPKGFVSRLKEH